MKTVDGSATDKNGREVPALQLVCDKCGGGSFVIFLLGEKQHQHLQCINCDESFCDGSCNNEKAAR